MAWAFLESKHARISALNHTVHTYIYTTHSWLVCFSDNDWRGKRWKCGYRKDWRTQTDWEDECPGGRRPSFHREPRECPPRPSKQQKYSKRQKYNKRQKFSKWLYGQSIWSIMYKLKFRENATGHDIHMRRYLSALLSWRIITS